MLINHIQVRPAGNGLVRFQVTGPAFPTGYASGNVQTTGKAVDALEAAKATEPVLFHSFRGTEMVYIKAGESDGKVYAGKAGIPICTLDALLKGVGAPSPAYSEDASKAVSARVRDLSKGFANPALQKVEAKATAKAPKATELAEIASVLADIAKKLAKLTE